MGDWEALVRAICERPDDDTPRLIAADYLDGDGSPAWAELIRVQCRMARGHLSPEEYGDLAARERAAWWSGAVFAILDRLGRPVPDCVYHLATDRPHFIPRHAEAYIDRGFTHALCCPVRAFIAGAAAVFAAHPILSVHVNDREPYRGGDGRFSWGLRLWPVRAGDPDQLPPQLAAVIKRDCVKRGPRYRLFQPTADAAHLMLSRACVVYGRKAARLGRIDDKGIP